MWLVCKMSTRMCKNSTGSGVNYGSPYGVWFRFQGRVTEAMACTSHVWGLGDDVNFLFLKLLHHESVKPVYLQVWLARPSHLLAGHTLVAQA